MHFRSMLMTAVAVLVTAAPLTAQTSGVDAIVAQFYPQRLVEAGERASETVERRQCSAVYDTQASGAPRTIVAAYTNTSTAAIRVLQADASGFRVVASAPQSLDLFGGECEVRLLDVDHDGRAEIVVTFSVMVNEVSWVLKWDGRQLVNLTPTADNGDGTLISLLRNADFIDVDNDGVPEIFVGGQYPPPSDGSPAKPGSLYKLSDGRYAQTELVVGLWIFERSTGTPELDRVPVPLPRGARGPFTLHLVNGGADGRARVTSGEVFLNGERILRPDDFGARVDVIDRPINLAADNALSVRLAGAPGSRILVILRSRGWE
jgi:hypothetical protein